MGLHPNADKLRLFRAAVGFRVNVFVSITTSINGF
jgi:hypothetical protein